MAQQQDLQGKVALVTGANSGIGQVTARQLALRGAHVIVACRSEEKTRPVLAEIELLSNGRAKAEFLPLDLGNLDSVKRCAAQFLARGLPLHLLIANAGLAGKRGLTESGFERAFGVCHVGHFLLTRLLLERLRQSAPARIVVVASRAHTHVKTLELERVRESARSFAALGEYGQAKLANILFARELAQRLQGSGVTTYSLHPGVVATDVWRSAPRWLAALAKRLMLSPEQGAATTIYCATAPELATNSGLYYEKCQEAEPAAVARDAALAAKLWQLSEEWTGPWLAG